MNNHLPPSMREPQKQEGVKIVIQWLALVIALGLILLISTVPLGLTEQLVFAMLAMGFTFLVRPENDKSRFRLILLMLVSFGITCRYIYWRITVSMGWFDPDVHLTFWDHFFSIGLLLAEVYAWSVLFLGFIQSIWPLRRPVLPLPVDRSAWPTVDVYIPTYNEPLDIVIPSILAARDLDWPEDKLNVYVLDDGCRPEFEAFARKVGVRYIQRKDSAGAKAGNINNALRITDGEYIAIFDSDHAPVRSFLRKTMGWFLRDGNLGLLQTPHLFFTPDPVERNLGIYKKVPNEGQLFYGLVQDGNDNWNAAFFCGSCAVLRRQALDEIGGITADTVTEDAHTSLKMHKQGWNSAYLNMPLAAGLATEKLSQHIGQRRRWARGMIQIFRKDNPLFARGLSLLQRLSYFNAMLHFLFSVPRLVFLTAPLAYLLFQVHVIQASAAMIAVYALPHIFQAHIANAAMQGRFRHSFWAEVYETILAPHIVIPTIAAFFAPNRGKFNVTSKGGVVSRDHFDWSSAGFIFVLLLLNILGLVFAYFRYFYWNTFETDTVLLNFGWTVYNTIIIGAALAVAWEKRQRRKHPRIERTFPAQVMTADGRRFEAMTKDLSIGDLSLELKGSAPVQPHEFVDILLSDKGEKPLRFRARVATCSADRIGVVFEELTANQLAKLVYLAHGKDKAWNAWYLACEPSKPLRSFLEIVRFGILGAFKALFKREKTESGAQLKPRFAVLGWVVLLIVLAIGGYLYPQYSNAAETPASDTQAGQTLMFRLADLGRDKDIALRGGNTDEDVWFSLPTELVVKQADFELGFALSGALLRDYKALQVRLNEHEIGQIPLNEITTESPYRNTFRIDPLLVSSNNRLSFRLLPKQPDYCERLDPAAAQALISNQSRIRLRAERINLVNDLALLPIPFFDAKASKRQPLPFVFPAALASDMTTLRAAGVLSSWFGVKGGWKSGDFPVLVDQLPNHHAVVFATADAHPAYLDGLEIEGPGVAIVSHPQQPATKLLVIMGVNNDQLLDAVDTLIASAGQGTLSGSRVDFPSPAKPQRRAPYDAPSWLATGQINRFGDFIEPGALTVKGLFHADIPVKFRVPPDLYALDGHDPNVSLGFGFSGFRPASDSRLDVMLNGEGLNQFELKPVANTDHGQDSDAQAAVAGKRQVSFALPLGKLAGENTLSLFFDFRADDDNRVCLNQGQSGISGTIDPDSTIDLKGFSHYGKFPDLKSFARLGFPFTRLADLSETAVVLSENPGKDDVYAFLNLMAKAGASTGLPAFRVAVTTSGDVTRYADRDLLLLGSYRENRLLQSWSDAMPVSIHDGRWTARRTGLFEKLEHLFSSQPLNDTADAESYLDDQVEGSVILMGFRSPLNSSRNVVALTAREASSLPGYVTSLFDEGFARAIRGEVSVAGRSEVANFTLFPSYYLGDLPWFTSLRLMMARHVLLLFLVFLTAVLVAGWSYTGLLKRHARARISNASTVRA